MCVTRPPLAPLHALARARHIPRCRSALFLPWGSRGSTGGRGGRGEHVTSLSYHLLINISFGMKPLLGRPASLDSRFSRSSLEAYVSNRITNQTENSPTDTPQHKQANQSNKPNKQTRTPPPLSTLTNTILFLTKIGNEQATRKATLGGRGRERKKTRTADFGE